jgi:hypothetical protein
MTRRLQLLAAVALLVVAPSLAAAQRRAPARRPAPTGQEISAAARRYRLLSELASTDSLQGRQIRYTPAEALDSLALESGVLLGVLENELAGDETGLPPGRYNIFLALVDGKPRVYAESGGRIVVEALRVSVTPQPNAAAGRHRPRFIARGWGYYSILRSSYYGYGYAAICGPTICGYYYYL